MARRVLNRKELRAASDAAERLDKDGGAAAATGEEAGTKKKAKKAPAAPGTKPKAKRRTKAPQRMRVIWVVFNNSNQPVARYDYPKKDDADAHAARLVADKKITHFVQAIKEPIEETEEEKEAAKEAAKAAKKKK